MRFWRSLSGILACLPLGEWLCMLGGLCISAFVVVCGRCIVHRLCSTTCKHPCLQPLCERYQASLLGRRVRLYQPYGWFSKALLLSPLFHLGKAGKDAWRWTPKAHQEDAPQSVHKGLGVRDREIALLIKKIDFFDKLSHRHSRWLFSALMRYYPEISWLLRQIVLY